MPSLPPHVLFGAAYYLEYGPSDRLKSDLDLMVDAGFSVIRVGESVWSTWEPEDGRFDLEWLRPVLDGAHERGIGVVLGTPTYAIPPWLARQYPEIAGERSTGQRIGWGARQEVDYTHAAFRHHAERIIRAVIGTYADHPAVIGFQVDNEPGLELFHNENVFQKFVDHLRHTYGDVDTLNEEWGLVYWSHRLSTWADLWRPDGNFQPQYDIAWRDFQAALTTEFIAWQAGIVREYADDETHFITTCVSFERPAVEESRIADALTHVSGNPYYGMQNELRLPADEHEPPFWQTTGVCALNLTADRMWGSRQQSFLVTETNAASIGMPWDNRPAFDGQWRQAAWSLISRGAQMIEYWHWNTLRFGAETYWGGVLPHSGRPGRAYREIAQLGAEIKTAGSRLAGFTPDADVVFLYDPRSKWLMQKYPPLPDADGNPDSRAYHRIFDAFYRGAFDAGLQARVVHPRQLLTGPASDPHTVTPQEFAKRHPVLVAAAYYLADADLIRWLRDYADAGGHLVLGPRTGYADLEGRASSDIAPAGLVEAAGLTYDEFSNIGEPVGVASSADSDLAIDQGATATRWIDGLLPDTAQSLVAYDDSHFGRWPAVVTNTWGAGRVTTVGTVPGLSLAASVLGWAGSARHGWTGLPDSVTVRTGVNSDGERVTVVHNWSADATSVRAPADQHNLLMGQPVTVNDTIHLGPWDVQVFVRDIGDLG